MNLCLKFVEHLSYQGENIEFKEEALAVLHLQWLS